jgi:hypothetical protein
MSHLIEVLLEAIFKLLYIAGEIFWALPSSKFKSKMEATPEELADDKKTIPEAQTVIKTTPSEQTVVRREDD